MIKPREQKSNPILLFPRVRLAAHLIHVDRDGNILVEREDGGMGHEVNDDDVVSVSEGAVWVLQNGDVVQAYPRERVPDHSPVLREIDRGTMLITAFSGGILGASRAMGHASARVLTDLEAFRGLVTLSDGALNYAISTNLSNAVSTDQHRANLSELERLVRSGGSLDHEIRTFLAKIRNPKDVIERHNVYRMVLIVRAVQRRANRITDAKSDALEAVTTIGLDVARYIGAVVATAAQMRTELLDVQPWWTGNDDEIGCNEAKKRRRNFVTRLQRYRVEMFAVTAKPFRCWTLNAAERLQDLAVWIEGGQYGNVLVTARYIVDLMEAIIVREGISRCMRITSEKLDDVSRMTAILLLTNFTTWIDRRQSIPGLIDLIRAQPIIDRIGGVMYMSPWEEIQAAARDVERDFDALLG